LQSSLWIDALEGVLVGAFGGGADPEVRSTAISVGREALVQLARSYLGTQRGVSCQDVRMPVTDSQSDDQNTLLYLMQYGRFIQKIAPNATMERLQHRLEDLARQAVADCDTLEAFLGFEPAQRLRTYPGSVKEVIDPKQSGFMFEITLQAEYTLDLLSLPKVQMPNGTLEYMASLYQYLDGYPYPSVGEGGVTCESSGFIDNAFVATHAIWFMSGLERFQLDPKRSAKLFRYLRRNFYALLELGNLDLLGEFLDSFRELNCTEGNDAQTRDGTIFLLDLYNRSDGQWGHVPDTGLEKNLTEYFRFHKPLCAYLGLRTRQVEQSAHNTPGETLQKMMAYMPARRARESAVTRAVARPRMDSSS